MGKYKTLALNTAIFGICNFTSKLLVFIMLPFYTTMLTKEEFGTSDLINTVVSFLAPIFSLSIANGVMRFALDKKQDIREVFSFGMKVTILGSLILILAYPIIKYVPIVNDFIWFFLLLYVTHVFHSLTGLFARGLNRMKQVGIAGVISSFVVVGCNILFLFVFRFGVEGYLASIIISNVVFSSYLFIACKMYNYVTTSTHKTLEKEMLCYSIPMIPNTLSWWIQHSANRYVLNYFCGVGEVGLYSAASKIPTIIDTFRGIFVQAWQLSTITEYENEDSKKFFISVYRMYYVFLVLFCSSLLLATKIIAHVLYSKAFFEAWKFTPLLIVAILFSSMVAFYSPTYLAHKKTNKLFISTLLGAIITIVANLAIVPFIGAIGAAISTLISNFCIYIYLYFDSQKYMGFKLGRINQFITYSIMSIWAVIITFCSIEPMGIISIAIFVAILLLNKNDLVTLYSSSKKIIKKKV